MFLRDIKIKGQKKSAIITVPQFSFAQRQPEERRHMPLPPPKVVFRLDGLPKHHDKVTTYGGGGGKPIKMKSGPLMGWSVGGGKRSQVYGNT